MMRRIVPFIVLLLWAGGSMAQKPRPESDGYIPAAVDYDNPEMWHIVRNDSTGCGADVFYVPSTWEFDWMTPDSTVCHYADPSLRRHRSHMAIEMRRVARYMADGNDFYSPHYRHITLDTWATLDEAYIERCYHTVAFSDVEAAFVHFLQHRGGGRPFVLAGFSQGAKSVVELQKIMPDSVRGLLVAAYVMGYKVTPDDTAACPAIRAAAGAEDTGVTICYNSVSDVQFIKPIISEPNTMCINPVNWRTDGEPAMLGDSISVTLVPERRVLVVKGFDGSAYKPIFGFINVGDYHGAEPWLYSESLRENIRRRIAAWRQADKR